MLRALLSYSVKGAALLAWFSMAIGSLLLIVGSLAAMRAQRAPVLVLSDPIVALLCGSLLLVLVITVLWLFRRVVTQAQQHAAALEAIHLAAQPLDGMERGAAFEAREWLNAAQAYLTPDA